MENQMDSQNLQPQNLQPQNPMPEYKPKKSHGKLVAIIFIVILLFAAAGAVFYLYYEKIGPFAVAPYSEKNFLSGILGASSRINSATYSVSASLNMSNREADALPFTSKLSNAEELKKQYENDAKRMQDVNSLMSSLRYSGKTSYPASILSYNKKDPVTKKSYTYKTTENAKNFALTVTFETDNAIFKIMQSYNFSPEKTIIDGKKVTFTKDSYSYIYLSSVPPKPAFVYLSDLLSKFPAESKASVSATVLTDLNKQSPDWKVGLDATGDFGDLTYKFNVEALKKAATYYFKINNFPSLFLGFLNIQKGQWIKVEPDKINSGIKQAEDKYKKNREEIVALLKKVIKLADESSVITFKSKPKQEKVDGKNLYRYELKFNKESILPFYQKVIEEINNSNIKKNYPTTQYQGLLDYLKSPEFSEVFDYYQKNTTITVWVDQQGFPEIVSYAMRIVPQDSVTQLKDKQANVVFKLELSDINQPVKIEAPANAKDYKDIMQSK